MSRVPSGLLDHDEDRPPKVARLPVAGHGHVGVAERGDDLVARGARGAVVGPKGPQRDRGIDLHRPFASARGAAGDDLLEPHGFDEGQVLQEPGEVGARFHGAAPGVGFAEPGQLLEESGPLTIERGQKLLDFRSHGGSVTGFVD